MTRIQRTFVLFLVGSILIGDVSSAFGQLKFFVWFRERIGERQAKVADQAKADAEWQKKHFSSPAAQKEFVAAVKKARCNTCHIKGEKKPIRNPFGATLSQALQAQLQMNGKAITAALKNSAPSDVKQKVQEAFYSCLDKALSSPSDPESKASATFGDRLQEGKLPTSS